MAARSLPRRRRFRTSERGLQTQPVRSAGPTARRGSRGGGTRQMERTTTLGSRRTRLLRRLEVIDIPGCWDRMDALGRAREQTRAKPAYASAVTVTGSPLGGALLHVLGAERPRTLLRALR